MANKPWFDILLAVRKASLDGQRPITAQDVSREAKIRDTEKSSADQIASAWLGKFLRWGYVVVDGSAKGDRRWIRTYKVTRWGLEFKPSKR